MSGINADGTLIRFETPAPGTAAAAAASTGDLAALSSSALKVSLWTKDDNGNIPLIWAADKGQAEALKIILDSLPGSSSSDRQHIINTRGYLGNTALSRAARGGHLECVKLLLDRDEIDPDIANEKEQYPLHFAAYKKFPNVVRVMLESGKCDTFVMDRKGRTPAEDTSVKEIREMILSHRASLKIT